jgi:hypothetical protein
MMMRSLLICLMFAVGNGSSHSLGSIDNVISGDYTAPQLWSGPCEEDLAYVCGISRPHADDKYHRRTNFEARACLAVINVSQQQAWTPCHSIFYAGKWMHGVS